MGRQAMLEMVRLVVRSQIQSAPVRVYLFGSWAREEERLTSDIDLAVEGEKQVLEELLPRLREALEESSVPYRVDVVNLAEAAPELLEKVQKEGILWSV